MADIALEMIGVSKKFRKGEMYDSLRDLIPALGKKLLGRQPGYVQDKRDFWALSDISFQVRKGDAFGIVGNNGAGKSTMLKLLSGILKPTRGTINVNGRLSALIEVGAGFHPDLTGRENIYLNGAILGMSRGEVRTKFDEIVAFSGLEEFIDTPVKRYSSGMYARLGFSVAAHVEPDILVVDEVLSVGDYVFQKKCMDKMNAVVQSGATVIFVSHNLRAVLELCQRSVLLDRGTIVTEGETGKVIQEYMSKAVERSQDVRDKLVYVSKVSVRRDGIEVLHFRSRDQAQIEIEIMANTSCEKLAVVLYLKDESYYEIFNTSSERLGCGTFSIKAGETFKCIYSLDLPLARGTYHIGVSIYRYDSQRTYDSRFPAATIYVSPDKDVRGVVDLNPAILAHNMISPEVREGDSR